MKAAVVIPTQRRAPYLEVALASIVPQARAAEAEVLVVDDGPDEATRAAAERHGARYLRHDAPRGLNAARNAALQATDAPLVCFVDDDVEVRPGWLAALLGAAAAASSASSQPPRTSTSSSTKHTSSASVACRAVLRAALRPRGASWPR